MNFLNTENSDFIKTIYDSTKISFFNSKNNNYGDILSDLKFDDDLLKIALDYELQKKKLEKKKAKLKSLNTEIESLIKRRIYR